MTLPVRALPILCLFVLLSQPPAALAVFGDGPEQEGVPILTDIVITGNTHTDTDLVLRELGLHIGQPLTMDELDVAWDHLEDVGYFSFVDMEYDDGEPGEVVLRVTLEEDLTTLYGPVIRVDRRHKYLLGGWLEENNFRGKGEKLEFRAVAYHIQRLSAAWSRPWLAGVKGLDLRLSLAGEQADFVFRPTRYRKWHADLDLRWSFWRSFFVAGGLQYGGFRHKDAYWWPGPDRGPGSSTAAVWHTDGEETYTQVRAAVGLDSRDNPWYPLRGVFGQAEVRRWSSHDFADYTETSLDARVFVPLPWEHVLAVRGWGRRVDGPAQLDNVLFLGGVESLRGYPYGQTEGDEGYLLTVEYRMPLFLMPISPDGELVGFGLHAFLDAGDAWYEGDDAGRRLLSYGAGAHLNLDTLQFRFEAAQTEDGDWHYQFTDRFNF